MGIVSDFVTLHAADLAAIKPKIQGAQNASVALQVPDFMVL